MTDGQSSISTGILARYVADAAMEVPGVRGLAGRRSVRIDENRVELHLCVDWNSPVPVVGGAVQARVGECLARMADVHPEAVDVVIDEVGPA
jgi:uncharacterized alkaline shock family protein YloU